MTYTVIAVLVVLEGMFGLGLLWLMRPTYNARQKTSDCHHDELVCTKCGLKFRPDSPELRRR